MALLTLQGSLVGQKNIPLYARIVVKEYSNLNQPATGERTDVRRYHKNVQI